MNEAKKKTRRRYAAEVTQQILAQCAEPGASNIQGQIPIDRLMNLGNRGRFQLTP